MYLKSLELNNFQKHKYLKIELSPKVNVIYGKSDSGKSCIIRAIRWLFFPNELRGDVVRREGSKKTSVIATLSNGAIIERIKSATLNRYKITIKGETKEYDTIGKGLPDEFYQIIKVKPVEVDKDHLILNVANQLSLPFLFDKSPTFRVKLFNKLTGNDIVDKVFQSLNKDLLQINREEKLENEHLKELQSSQEQIKQDINKTGKEYAKFSKLYEQIKLKVEKYDELNECQLKLTKVDDELGNVNNELESIKLIPDKNLIQLEKRIDRFDKLNSLVSHLKEIKEEVINVDKKLASIILPKININKLRDKIEVLEKLVELKLALKESNENKEKIEEELGNVIEGIKRESKQYKELLKKVGICPVCKTKLNEKAIEEIKL